MPLCPKCGASHDERAETCTKCGVVFAKLRAAPSPHSWLGRYEYKMIEVAENIVVKAEVGTGNEPAAYLQQIVNEQAREGWELYRIDEMKLTVDREAMFGTRVQGRPVGLYVITFRRTVPPDSPRREELAKMYAPPKSIGGTLQLGDEVYYSEGWFVRTARGPVLGPFNTKKEAEYAPR